MGSLKVMGGEPKLEEGASAAMLVDLSGARWRKSSYSNGGGGCVEVADGYGGAMPVRASKDPGGPVLVFAADAWWVFVAGVQGGEFRLSSE